MELLEAMPKLLGEPDRQSTVGYMYHLAHDRNPKYRSSYSNLFIYLYYLANVNPRSRSL